MGITLYLYAIQIVDQFLHNSKAFHQFGALIDNIFDVFFTFVPYSSSVFKLFWNLLQKSAEKNAPLDIE